MTRKRRRQEAFEEQTPEADPVQTEEEAAKAREEKEQEVWDAVREAHYEAIEQLPLTLQRQLLLMRQLDEQASSCVAHILPTLQKYIELRSRLAGKFPTGDSLQPGEDTNTSAAPTRTFTKPSMTAGKAKAESSRDMAQQIALFSEEILRASQEKVNIAQTNCDSVERHIQLLDQAIKEQEAALLSDPNDLVRIHLPELVIPQWRHRPAQSTLTVDPNMDQISEDQSPVDVVGDYPTEKRTSKRKGKDGKKGKQQDESASLTITLPAPQPSDEPELLYCYCNRVSFGEMIACDNSDCEREWFHYGCVGLLEPPEGEWFCEDCRLQLDDI